MRHLYLGLIIIIFVILYSEVSAASPVEVSVYPTPQLVKKGQEFNINISIDPVNNSISAAQFNLLFNSSFIEVKNVTEGNLFNQNGADAIFNSGILNNSDGTLINVWGLIITPGANVTTYGTLATITMIAKESGSSLLNLTNVIVSDPDSQAVQVNITNGSIDASSQTQTQTSGGSSGGGGGGGGGGTSGENYSNIELKEKYDHFIYKDLTTSYCFKNVSNPIICINITGKTNAGEISTAAEVLRNVSSLVKTPPDGTIYRNVNIWVGTYGFATPQNIKDAVITFRVDKSWIKDNGMNSESITLLRYSDNWNALPAKKTGENAKEVFYEAHTIQFSPFAIIGKKSGYQDSAQFYQVNLNTEPPQQQETATKGSEAPESVPASSTLTIFLLIGIVVVGLVNVTLIYKIKMTRDKDIFNIK